MPQINKKFKDVSWKILNTQQSNEPPYGGHPILFPCADLNCTPTANISVSLKYKDLLQ